MKMTKYRMFNDSDPSVKMEPSDICPKEAFTTGDHTELNHSLYETKDESILAGVWTCAPSREVIDAYPVNEMMTVLGGSVSITNAAGEVEIFTKGDSFFIPKGAKVIWEITETLTKHYMIAA